MEASPLEGKGTEREYVTSGYPYADFYDGDYDSEDLFVETGSKCAHHVSSLRPYQRKAFYNGTLHLNFPSKRRISSSRYCTGQIGKFPIPKNTAQTTNCRKTGA
jgi:hypothetical protein